MIEVLAPCAGTAIPMTEVNDPIFSAQTVGPGVGIEPKPERSAVVAPVSGLLLSLKPHAFIILVEGRVGVLVHVGINTVRLEGEGFELKTEQGQEVTAGTPIVEWDPSALTDPDMHDTVIVAVMDQAPDSIEGANLGHVESGDPIFQIA